MRWQSVFPAYAGVIPLDVRLIGTCSGIPRVCGGDPGLTQKFATAEVFPAYAGVILCGGIAFAPNLCIPRVCGGDPAPVNMMDKNILYSPRMRG